MSERRGIVTAGTWCVDLNKTIARWPSEDTMSTYLEVDRQGGGSGSNMAIDLKRLDADLPVEAMGVIGDDDDGRFLLGRCEAFGIDRRGLATLPGDGTPFSDCFNSLESGRRTHFYSPGVATLLSPEHFDFGRTEARILHLGLPGAHKVFDSSQIPGEIIDLTIANSKTLAETPAFGKALAGIWYETMAIMSAESAEGRAARTEMSKASGTDLAGFESQLRTTRMFYKPAEAAAFAKSAELPKTLRLVRDFLFSHGLFGEGAKSPDVVGIQFGDGSVLGDKSHITFRFDPAYMDAAAAGTL